MDSDSETELIVYELMEECIASEDSIKFFLAGYRVFYTTKEVWQSIQRLYNNYHDAKKVREYIWRCLKIWFKTYCVQDFKNNRALANEVFTFTSKKFKDKKLTSKLKTLFIERIAKEQPPLPNIPARCEAFGQPIPLYHNHIFDFAIDQVVETLDIMCVNYFRSLSLGQELAGITSAFFDHITYHVASHVLWGKQTRHRAREYQFLLKVAVKLRWKHNYEMAFAVYQGLIQNSVQKLARTLKKVSSSSKKSLATLDFLFDPKGGYENYIREVNALDEPYVPILAILSRQICNIQGSGGAKTAGKILIPVVETQKREVEFPNRQIQQIILQPSFSIQKLIELASLRENPSIGSSESSESEGHNSRIDVVSEGSDHEMSPRHFGTPRVIPKLPISDRVPTRLEIHSPLRKTISFSSNLSPMNSGRISPSSPRPVSKSRIMRTRKIRDLKTQMTNNPVFWTRSRVIEWLQENGFENYKVNFIKAEIDGTSLLNMNKHRLEDLGVRPNDHIRFLKKIQNLREI